MRYQFRLGEVTSKIGSGATPTGGKEAYESEGVPLVRSQNVYDCAFDYDNLAFLNAKQADKLAQVVIERDDVLLNITGASVARCCLAPNDLSGGRVNQHVAIVRADRKNAWGPFLAYLLASPEYKNRLLNHANGGATREALTKSGLEQFEVMLPDLVSQKRAAGILFAYDNLIEVNQRRIAILEEMATRLFDEWFVRFRYPGHEAVPLVKTELGLAPQGWKTGVLRDLVIINPETLSPKAAPSRINYIDISSVSVGQVDAISSMEFAEAPGRARRIVRHGDIIWSTVRPNRRSHALLLDVEPNTVASTGFAVMRARSDAWAWAYAASETDAFVSFLVGRARGSAYPAVVGTDFEEVPTLIPPPNMRLRYQSVAGPIFEMSAKLKAENTRLRAARDLLLPKLISGEIDVSRAEAAFPLAAE